MKPAIADFASLTVRLPYRISSNSINECGLGSQKSQELKSIYKCQPPKFQFSIHDSKLNDIFSASILASQFFIQNYYCYNMIMK